MGLKTQSRLGGTSSEIPGGPAISKSLARETLGLFFCVCIQLVHIDNGVV